MAFDISYNITARDRFSAVARKINRAGQSVVRSMDNIARKAVKAGRAIRSVGKGISLKFSAPLLIAGGVALKTAANMETLETGLTVMLGSAEKGKKAFEELADFTAKTPFRLEGVSITAKQLLAAGVDVDNLQDKLSFLGDIAAGANVPLADMGGIFAKIKNKGRAYTEELLQLSDRGIPILDVLAKSMNVSKDAVFDLASKGKISFDIMEDAMRSMAGERGIFENAMIRQSKTIAGSISTLRDNINLVTGATGQWFSDTVKLTDGIAALNEKIDPKAVREWFDEFSENSPILAKISAGVLTFASVLGPMVIAVGSALSSLGFMVLGLKALNVALFVGTLRMIFITGPIKAWTAVQWLLNAAMTANPITLIILGIAALIVGIVLLVKHWDVVKEKMMAVWAVIRTLIDQGFAKLESAFPSLIDKMKSFANGVIDFFVLPLQLALKAIDAIAGTDLATKLDNAVSKIKLDVDTSGLSQPSNGAIAGAGATQKVQSDININLNAPPGVVKNAEAKTNGNGRVNIGQNTALVGLAGA